MARYYDINIDEYKKSLWPSEGSREGGIQPGDAEYKDAIEKTRRELRRGINTSPIASQFGRTTSAHNKVCAICETDFVGAVNSKYCGPICAAEAHKRKHAKRTNNTNS